MKKNIIIILAVILAAAAIVASALTVRYLREKKKENEPYSPAPGEYYDPDQLPEWDTNI